VDRFVARQNVVRFRQRLAEERDPEARAHLKRLLDEANQQLEQAEEAHRNHPPKETG
jgi:hypothetical protein